MRAVSGCGLVKEAAVMRIMARGYDIDLTSPIELDTLEECIECNIIVSYRHYTSSREGPVLSSS